MLGSFPPFAPAALPFPSLQAFLLCPAIITCKPEGQKKKGGRLTVRGRPLGMWIILEEPVRVRLLLHGAVLNTPILEGWGVGRKTVILIFTLEA